MATLTALRLLQLGLEDERGDEWWLRPPWNRHKARPSVLDVERLLRAHAEELRQGLARWLDNEGMSRPKCSYVTPSAAPDRRKPKRPARRAIPSPHASALFCANPADYLLAR
jgi:hypothetical protein